MLSQMGFLRYVTVGLRACWRFGFRLVEYMVAYEFRERRKCHEESAEIGGSRDLYCQEGRHEAGLHPHQTNKDWTMAA